LAPAASDPRFLVNRFTLTVNYNYSSAAYSPIRFPVLLPSMLIFISYDFYYIKQIITFVVSLEEMNIKSR